MHEASPRSAPVARLAICLLIGTLIFWGSIGTIGLIEKLIRDGWTEAVSGMMRAIAALTFAQCLRLIGLSAGLSLIACFPVYCLRPPHALAPLLFCAAVATVTLTGCLIFENWYWFGRFAFPPPSVMAVTALVALATAVTSRAIVAHLENSGRMQ